MSETQRSTENAPAVKTIKKAYSSPTLTECGTVAKLTMAKGTTNTEIGQVVRKGCL
jgi:hypothetical protein